MKNKVVIITGAEGNLGRVAMKRFHEQGAKVAAVSYGKNPTPEFASMALDECDLTNPETTKRVVTQVNEKLGTPSVLINIAGGFTWKLISETTYDDVDHMFQMNFRTAFNMTKSILPHLGDINNARIINIGALGAVKATAGMAAYAISKSAVMRLTEAVADETPDNITVNAIMPSIIDTPENRADMPDSDFNKWVKAEEIVEQMLYLASDASSGINGALIPLNGRL